VKKVLVIVTLIVCGAAIILGNLHWNEKISAQGESTATNIEQADENKKEEQVESESDNLVYAVNLPEKLQEKIKEATDPDKPVKFVIFGTSEAEGTWIDSFTKELAANYGKEVFEITVISTGDNSTREIVNEGTFEEINQLNPDVLLFEPPMLKDNGNVGISNTLSNLEKMFESWQEVNKELVLMVQPPNPLYAATYYPSEVQQLQKFTEGNDLIYLNHWDNWPALDDVKMKDYLTEDNKANEKGYAIWAEYLTEYFVAK